MTGRQGGAPYVDDARRALARRRRRRRIRIGLAWGVLGITLLVAGLGVRAGGGAILGWTRSHTRLFEVREVNVAATRWVAPWEVVNASGIEPGDDIVAIDPEAVARAVERHPRVRSATVQRQWDRVVHIEVEENPPVALWMNDRPLEVAADGTVLGLPPTAGRADWPVSGFGPGQARGLGLPLLTGVPGKGIDPGERLEDPAVTEALAFLARLRIYGDGGEGWISEIWAGTPGDLVAVTLNGGVRVRIGDGRLSRRKLDALHAVLARIGREAEPVAFVDARFRHQVIVKAG